MPKQLGPLEVVCDAPPYDIVQGCRLIGLKSPEDVRWCRVGHFLDARGGWRDLFKYSPWKMLLGGGAAGKACTCGQPLPELEKYLFEYNTGFEVSYVVGQCDRCHTIFWEED